MIYHRFYIILFIDYHAILMPVFKRIIFRRFLKMVNIKSIFALYNTIFQEAK